jgi:hypothetical protein
MTAPHSEPPSWHTSNYYLEYTLNNCVVIISILSYILLNTHKLNLTYNYWRTKYLYDLWLDKIIPKNNDEGRAIYGNLANKINTLYWPVENSIPKNNDRNIL